MVKPDCQSEKSKLAVSATLPKRAAQMLSAYLRTSNSRLFH